MADREGSGITRLEFDPTGAVTDRPLLLIPFGSTEQHGSHLPLSTDTVIAEEVALRVAARLAEQGKHVVVAPAVHYGSSGEHQSFAGTLSIGTPALTQLTTELARSALTWASSVLIVNGHGGNAAALSEAVSQLIAEELRAAWVFCDPDSSETDAHAGLTETSLMLHLRPERVRLQLAEAGNTAPIAELMPRLRAEGVASVSPNGVLGDPRGATAEQGQQLLDAIVHDVVRRVSEWMPDAHGILR